MGKGESGECFSDLVQVPGDTDILVTHSPAFGRLDTTRRREAAGCPHLRDAIEIIRYFIEIVLKILYFSTFPYRPLVHLCGHIHESHGILQSDRTTTVNAALLDREGRLAWQPVVLGACCFQKTHEDCGRRTRIFSNY